MPMAELVTINGQQVDIAGLPVTEVPRSLVTGVLLDPATAVGVQVTLTVKGGPPSIASDWAEAANVAQAASQLAGGLGIPVATGTASTP